MSGKLLHANTLSARQMALFEIGMPLLCLLETVPFHCHNSVLAVGKKPEWDSKPA